MGFWCHFASTLYMKSAIFVTKCHLYNNLWIKYYESSRLLCLFAVPLQRQIDNVFIIYI